MAKYKKAHPLITEEEFLEKVKQVEEFISTPKGKK